MSAITPAPPHWLDRAAPPLAAAVHVAVALLLKARGFTILVFDPPWDWFWQTLPAAALRANLGEAIWHLHMQPPLYNLWGALWLHLFPGDSAPLEAMYYAHIGLGALVSAMTYASGRALGLGRRASAVAGLLVALLPSLLLYEPYPLYEMLCLFLLTAAVWAVSRYQFARRRGWLSVAVAALTLLVLTRSAYHLVLLAPVVAVLALALPNRRLRFAVLAVIIALPALSWYAKNQVQFGFFGASSWAGMNLWRIAPAPGDEAQALVAAGVIAPVTAQLTPFNRPSRYAAFGFTQTSDVPVLKGEDHNNINIVAVAKVYSRSARAMILHAPGRYLANVAAAFVRFAAPSASHHHLDENRARLPTPWQWAIAAEEWLRPTFVVLLAGLLLFGWLLALRLRRGATMIGLVQELPSAMLVAGLLVYSTLVSVMLEYKENMRFRFVIEPLIWLFAAGMTATVMRELRLHCRHSAQATGLNPDRNTDRGMLT